MSVPMAFMKIKIDGMSIVGNAEHHLHVDDIVVDGLSWDMNAKQAGMARSTGNARTETRLGEIKLDKFFDRASTALAKALLLRKKVEVATITMLNMEMAEEASSKMMVLEIKDGFVEGVDLSVGSAGNAAAVKESVRISFREIRLDYYPPDLARIGRPGAMPAFELSANRAG